MSFQGRFAAVAEGWRGRLEPRQAAPQVPCPSREVGGLGCAGGSVEGQRPDSSDSWTLGSPSSLLPSQEKGFLLMTLTAILVSYAGVMSSVPCVLSVAAITPPSPHLRQPEWLCPRARTPGWDGVRDCCIGGLKLVLPWLPGARPWGSFLE